MMVTAIMANDGYHWNRTGRTMIRPADIAKPMEREAER